MEYITKPLLNFRSGIFYRSGFKDHSPFASGAGFQVFENINKKHRVTERAAKMYKYTPVTPIIKAFGGEKNGRTSIHLPQIASSRP